MATNPSILAYQQAQRLPVPDLSQVQQMPAQAAPVAPPVNPAANPLLGAPAPTLPSVIQTPDASIGNTQTRLLGDQGELQRLKSTGDGISQIGNPILRGAARVGDVLESILAPGAAAYTPGTAMHHQLLLGQTQRQVNNDLQNQQQQATTGQTEANTNYLNQKPEIEQSKIDQKQTAVQERVGQAAAARGQLVSWDANGLPTFTDDHTSQAFADHQALSSLHNSTAKKNDLLTEAKVNSYIPGTNEYAQWKKKVDQVDQQHAIALQALGLRGEGLQLRRNDQQANFYGLGPNGEPLPNAPQFEDDDGNVVTGGLKGAKTAITQQGAVGQFKDLAGSIKRTGAYLDTLHNSGSSLSDVRVIDALNGAEGGVLSTAIRSNLLKSGLSPEQVNAVAGLASFREQLGTLRAAAKGSTAEAQTQRMLEAAPTAGDTPELANRKMLELQATYDRLAPSVSTIGGGLSLGGRGGHVNNSKPSGLVRAIDTNGVLHEAPAGTPLPAGWKAQ